MFHVFRLFYLGRTETVHPTSKASQMWVRAMCDDSVTSADRIKLLREAVSEQSKFRLEATMGRGCDRHLLALMCAAWEIDMDMPQMFKDKVLLILHLQSSYSFVRLLSCFHAGVADAVRCVDLAIAQHVLRVRLPHRPRQVVRRFRSDGRRWLRHRLLHPGRRPA